MLSELKSIYDEKNGLSQKLSQLAENFMPGGNSSMSTPTNNQLEQSSMVLD
jgi:hypothetical protein